MDRGEWGWGFRLALFRFEEDAWPLLGLAACLVGYLIVICCSEFQTDSDGLLARADGAEDELRL